MNLQQKIFKKFFKDDKDRTILAHTPFGDIFFKEEDETYYTLQIYIGDNDKNTFLFSLHKIGDNKNEYNNFIKQGDFFVEPHLPELYNKIFFRDGLFEELSKAKPKTNYNIYVAGKTKCNNIKLEDIKILPFNDFCELALEHGKFD